MTPSAISIRLIGGIVIPLLFFLACGGRAQSDEATPTATSSLDRLPPDEAGETIRRSVAFAAGSWDAWATTQSVHYTKTTINFDSTGGERERFVQLHQYALHPGPRMRIAWQADGRDYLLINNGMEARKWVDGRAATSQSDRDEAWNSTFGSHYVFCMPFKLADSGAVLTYEGRVSLPEIGDAIAVRVDYEQGAGSAGGMHTWTYFFSPEDYRLVANHLQYGPDDYSYTEYVDYRRIDGIHMPTRRYGYRSGPNYERFEQTSEIFYDDVQFDVRLPDSLFRF